MSQEGTIQLINTTQIVDDDSDQSDVSILSETSNQGTGAGGANTNASGLPFEIKISMKKD
jgi:hypothetical protein